MLGDACGDCSIVVGDSCLPCPDGSDFPECAGCVGGARPPKLSWGQEFLIPVAVGVTTTLAIAWITSRLSK